MFNLTLYKHEVLRSVKTFVIFAVLLAFELISTITMYQPEMQKMLDSIMEMMPELAGVLGMATGATTLDGYIASYMYGFVMQTIPMVFVCLCVNRAVASYVDRGSIANLLVSPVKRAEIAVTQMFAIVTSVFALIAFSAGFQIVIAEVMFPNELDVGSFIVLNIGLLALQLFIAGFCFLCSCIFNDSKYSIGIGAGVPALMFILKMLASSGESVENIKYATFFTLFQPENIIAWDAGAL
ncbi:MAG: ABC transporter permease subunit, partial [Bifidobacteriaceae bacterium]|nr:ABC transporter permease subunit [Bifidobacteriaceae bacterium]